MGRLAANRHATAEYDIYCCRVNSMEVSPHLAYDTESTEAEARRLWQEGVQKFVDAYDRLLNAIEQQLAPPKR